IPRLRRHFAPLRRPAMCSPFPYTTLFRSLPPADEQRPDPGRGGRAAVRRGGIPAQGRVRGGGGIRAGAGGDGALDQVRRCEEAGDRKSTRLNSSHVKISYAVFCLKKKM